ncbi:MAG TPA: glycosyltransferase [Ignavibacteriaceae bacterium]|nr:glycosyltransferase [Ignavibacteriaceae bacterium]
MPKIFAVLMKYDYGIKSRGYSYEYYNIYLPLSNAFGDENIILFDFYSEYKSNGKDAMNKKLKGAIISEKPDIALFVLYEDEFDEKTISSLQDFTKTVVYFIDDPWRIDYAKKWRKHFSFFTTPDYYMLKKYESQGIDNVIYSPFGFNENIYEKRELPIKYDVSFVGGYSPLRHWILKQLQREDINVQVFGREWDGEKSWVSQDESVNIFNQSKINLNLSNAFIKDINFLFWCLTSPKTYKPLFFLKKNKEQIKGRHYEINGCGGFQLSYFIPGLNLVYEIDKEIAVYEHINQLAEEIKFFLKSDDLRVQIADNGYKRSQKDHKASSYIKNVIDSILHNK